MAAHDPIDPRVRLEISQWPSDAPRQHTTTTKPTGAGTLVLDQVHHEVDSRRAYEDVLVTCSSEA